MARRQPRKPSIGLNSASSRGAVGELLRVGAHGFRDLGDLLLAVRQEFVQRRIEQADGDRQPAHDLEQLDEIAALHRQQLGERRAPRLLVVGQDHLAHRADAVARRRTYARCGTGRCLRRRSARRRARRPACRHWRARRACAPCRPSPSAWRTRRTAPARIMSTLPASTWPVEPSMVMTSPFLKTLAAGGHGLRVVIDADRAGAGDAGLAHAARDHRRVRGHAAARGENAFGGVHAVDVLRRWFRRAPG